MIINSDTKISVILKEYPQLNRYMAELKKHYPILDTAIGKMFLRKATIRDLSKRSGFSEERIIREIKERI